MKRHNWKLPSGTEVILCLWDTDIEKKITDKEEERIPMKKIGKKLLSGILSFCMIAGMMVTPTVTAHAEEKASGYSVALGSAIWDDATHTSFQYPHARITSSDKIKLLTVTVANGSFTKVGELGNPTVTDINETSRTWMFADGKDASEIQAAIRKMTFTPTARNKMTINVTVDGNDVRGFDSLPSGSKLTQWTNGHYYLYIPKTTSWTKAYNEASNYTLAGQQGYLTTLTDINEINYLINLDSNSCWIAGTRLLKADGSRIDGKKYFQYRQVR